MGLAPYGRPEFHDPRFVGCNKTVLENLGISGNFFQVRKQLTAHWMKRCDELSRAAGYDMSAVGDADRLKEPANANFAASTQKLFEDMILSSLRFLGDSCTNLGVLTRNVCLGGGSFLNCPANSRAFNESGFDQVYVPPGADDSGLAIGAALYLTHNLLGIPRVDQNSTGSSAAYLGRKTSAAEINQALEAHGGDLEVTPLANVAEDAGSALAEDKVIAWFEGRSEFGPRALGHRSVIADPRKLENWARVNHIKNREQWRPFAPAVLEEEQHDWFTDCPSPSPYMLFTGRVRRPDIPAVPHLDGTSRIQSVSKDGGGYRKLIEQFRSRTNCPVILNTSLNGPGDPIVESPREALEILKNSQLDALYFENHRVTKQKN